MFKGKYLLITFQILCVYIQIWERAHKRVSLNAYLHKFPINGYKVKFYKEVNNIQNGRNIATVITILYIIYHSTYIKLIIALV